MESDAPLHLESRAADTLHNPPPLPPSPGEPARRIRWLPLWLFAGALALLAGLRLAGQWRVPLPRCWLREFTGLPCPSCGCTRSLLAWSHFDLDQAFRFNPLFFACCVSGFLWLGLWLAGRLFDRRWLESLQARIDEWPLGWIFLALLGLNWLYLCLNLPK